METQKFKSVSIREIVNSALHGQPINVQSRELFELSDIDVDDDRFIVDEYADTLEVESYIRRVAEEKFVSDSNNVSSYPETPSSDPVPGSDDSNISNPVEN